MQRLQATTIGIYIMQYFNNMIIERTRPSIIFVPFPYEVKKAGLDRVIKK